MSISRITFKTQTYSPRVSKVDLVDPNKDDGDPTSSTMAHPVCRSVGAVKSSDNNMRDTHADGTSDKNGLTTKLINVKNGRDGGKHEQDTANTTGQKRAGVASQVQVLEDESGVVQNGVDTGPCI